MLDKGYSLHSLRHTFEVSLCSLSATDMINAGMRVEVLQQILGHQDIEMTLPEYFLDYRIVARAFQIGLRCTYRKVVE